MDLFFTLTRLTTSSLAMLASRTEVLRALDVLAGNSNPIAIWAHGYISHRQCGSDKYLFKLAIVERESAHCSVLGTCNKEAILCGGLVS